MTAARRVARQKVALKQRGGAVASIALDPQTVVDAEFLVASGWSTSRNAAINRAVQALAAAQRLVLGEKP